MNNTEYIVLKNIHDLGGGVRVKNPSDQEAEALRALVIRGFVEEETRIKDNNLMMRVTTYSVTDLGRVALSDYEDALDRQRQHDAQRKADAARKKAAEDAQAAINRKKQFRHDFKVAAFTVVLTLFLEHAGDVLYCIERMLVTIRTLWE